MLPDPTGGWTFRLDAVAEFAGDDPDDDALLAGLSDDRPQAEMPRCAIWTTSIGSPPLERALRGNGQWFLPHPWLTTFVGDAHVESVVGAELARLDPADLGPFGQVVLSAFRRRSVTQPVAAAARRRAVLHVQPDPDPDRPTTPPRQPGWSANRAVYERVRGRAAARSTR